MWRYWSLSGPYDNALASAWLTRGSMHHIRGWGSRGSKCWRCRWTLLQFLPLVRLYGFTCISWGPTCLLLFDVFTTVDWTKACNCLCRASMLGTCVFVGNYDFSPYLWMSILEGPNFIRRFFCFCSPSIGVYGEAVPSRHIGLPRYFCQKHCLAIL